MKSVNQILEVEYVTVSEIAKAVRISRMTVYRLIESKKIPSVKFGNSYRVPKIAIEKYLNENTRGAIN